VNAAIPFIRRTLNKRAEVPDRIGVAYKQVENAYVFYDVAPLNHLANDVPALCGVLMDHGKQTTDTAALAITPSRWVHIATLAVTVILFLAVSFAWPDLVSDPIKTFGTGGFFLTAFGLLFSIVEVMRTQSAALAAKEAARRAGDLARTPYNMRDVSECMTVIESVTHALNHGGSPRQQPLSRIIKLYTAVFQRTYADDTSPQRISLGVVQTYVAVKALKTGEHLLTQTLSEMLSDLAALGGQISLEVHEQ